MAGKNISNSYWRKTDPPILTPDQVRTGQEIAAAYGGFVIFLRCEGFYALIGEQARIAKEVYSLELEMQAGNTVCLFHASEVYKALRNFVRAGYFVAMCDPTIGGEGDLFT